MIGITRWLYERCVTLGVNFQFNTFAEVAEITALSPDVVILATGGMPELAQVPGAEELALSVWDVLSGDVVISPSVLVYDETGGQSWPTVAEFAANLYAAGVTISTDQRLISVERNGNKLSATIRNEYSAQVSTHTFDQVIIEAGTVPDVDHLDDLAPLAVNHGQADIQSLIEATQQPGLIDESPASGKFALFRIGDCVSARGIHAGMLDANRICQNLL